MMKKLMVLTGLIAMLLCGCGHETEVKTETVSVVETTIETMEEVTDELCDYAANLYIEAVREIYGDSFDDTKATCDLNGITYEGRFISWEYVEEVAYNLMIS